MEYLPIPEGDAESKDMKLKRTTYATRASWIVNWLLLFIKLYVVIFSKSKSVVASLVDSAGTADMTNNLYLHMFL